MKRQFYPHPASQHVLLQTIRTKSRFGKPFPSKDPSYGYFYFEKWLDISKVDEESVILEAFVMRLLMSNTEKYPGNRMFLMLSKQILIVCLRCNNDMTWVDHWVLKLFAHNFFRPLEK